KKKFGTHSVKRVKEICKPRIRLLKWKLNMGGYYDTGHIISQSMELIKNSKGKRVYIHLIPENVENPSIVRPQESLEKFFRDIGAKPVPGSNGEFWELPDFSKETFRRYYRFILGTEPPSDPYKMIEETKAMFKWAKTFWQQDCLRSLLDWIDRLFMSPAD
ncbi:MAG: hypothetical protein DRN92_04530, partial [Thermoproteota archaeon]